MLSFLFIIWYKDRGSCPFVLSLAIIISHLLSSRQEFLPCTMYRTTETLAQIFQLCPTVFGLILIVTDEVCRRFKAKGLRVMFQTNNVSQAYLAATRSHVYKVKPALHLEQRAERRQSLQTPNPSRQPV